MASREATAEFFRERGTGQTCGSPVWKGDPTHYAYSFCFARQAEATILSVSELLVFVDWRNYAVRWNYACTCSANCVWNSRWREGTDIPPHMDGVNGCYYDGHVKYVPVMTLNAAMQARQKPWNNL